MLHTFETRAELNPKSLFSGLIWQIFQYDSLLVGVQIFIFTEKIIHISSSIIPIMWHLLESVPN